MDTKQKTTTAGSLLEQAANAEMKIAGARRARGSGFEATGIGGYKIVAWSPAYQAVFDIVERAIEQTLDPGPPDEVEEATESLGRRAIVTREAVRDTEVLPLRVQTGDAINKAIAVTVARLEAKHAAVACQRIVRGAYEEIEHLRARAEAGVARALSPTRLLEGIDEAIRDGDAGLATVASALRRLKARAEAEPVRIESDLAASYAAMHDAEERLRVTAHATTRTRIMGVDRAVSQVIREVQVTIPRLTDERLSQIYLPLVSERMRDVERSLEDRAERGEARIRAVREAHERLRALRAEQLERLNGLGRVRWVGIPETAASRRAAVGQLVETLFAGMQRELRSILVQEAPQERILDDLLGRVRERIEAQSTMPSIDDAFLNQADPEKVALEIDQLIRDSEMPVALEPGTDRSSLRDLRCRVIRVPRGSRVADAMVRYAGYHAGAFDYTGRPDCIEVIVWQPGLSLRDTRLFHGDELPYREELADEAAPPTETFANDRIRALVKARRASDKGTRDKQSRVRDSRAPQRSAAARPMAREEQP